MATVMGRSMSRRAQEEPMEDPLEAERRNNQVQNTITRLDAVIDRLDSIVTLLSETADDQVTTVKTQSTSTITAEPRGADDGETPKLSRSSRSLGRAKKRNPSA